MKRIKLFENFSDEVVLVWENNKMASDIVEDIKTISYLLEENGFDLKYTFGSKYGDSINYFDVDEYNRLSNNEYLIHGGHWKRQMIDMIVVKAIGNTMTDPRTFQKVLNKSHLDAVDKYVDLLKEHLDYINPDNISKERSLMGNINIIIRL